MVQREGYIEVLVNEAVYRDLLDQVDELGAVSLSRRRAGGCGMDVVFGPDGEIRSMSCSGGCGLFDRLIGRTCRVIGQQTPGGGARFSCVCSGTWIDQIFTR
ncbi:hypothetical protein [Salinigranum halophilum]|uniref:hypothetical protein n=1 Tax=Salinigranum halophilum TaxID=2565931 RepID=UPI0010A94A01|nr:hypothetical protein [Salinigranum halophilum]